MFSLDLKQKFEHKRMGKDVPDKYKTLRLPTQVLVQFY